MGRHHRAQPRQHRPARRLALSAGVVGVGMLQAVGSAWAAPAPAAAAPAPAAPAPAAAGSGSPCAPTAKACVDISRKEAWLTDGHGKVVYGPVPVTTGGKGQETPIGTFSVMWKDKDHKSGQSKGPDGKPADMTNSVFFQPGDAFHSGSLNRASAGCVHLSDAASQRFFDYLQPYDQVQIIP